MYENGTYRNTQAYNTIYDPQMKNTKKTNWYSQDTDTACNVTCIEGI